MLKERRSAESIFTSWKFNCICFKKRSRDGKTVNLAVRNPFHTLPFLRSRLATISISGNRLQDTQKCHEVGLLDVAQTDGKSHVIKLDDFL